MKKAIIAIAIIGFSLTMSITAWAGTWKQDANGWWYENDDETYQKDGWFQDPSDSQWYYASDSGYILQNSWMRGYYLGESGAMLKNTTTPDGYNVGGDGVWDAYHYYFQDGIEFYPLNENSVNVIGLRAVLNTTVFGDIIVDSQTKVISASNKEMGNPVEWIKAQMDPQTGMLKRRNEEFITSGYIVSITGNHVDYIHEFATYSDPRPDYWITE